MAPPDRRIDATEVERAGCLAGGSLRRPGAGCAERAGRCSLRRRDTPPSAKGREKSKGSEAGAREGKEITVAAVTYLEAIRQALFEEMERDPAVVLLGEDVGVYGGAFKVTEGLLERFGWERVVDTPISETAIVGAAVGMGYLGLRPVAEMQFIDFIACCFNQITNFVAKSHYRWGAPVPMVLRGPAGGGVHGGPFHSANPEVYFVHTPGLKVVYPATAYDAKGLLKSAVRDNNPVLFFEHKFLYRRIKEELPSEEYTVPLGKAALRREGRDLTIVSYAAMMHTSLEAADLLAREGIEAEVIDLRTLLPLDRETILASVKKTNKLLVVHEDTRTGGIAGEIAALVCEGAFEDLDGPILRVTALDTPVPFSPPLEERFLPNVSSVANAARELARY
jgi:2-oxoisovalerate dehydrogenase E1 component beta subunit